jgi:hypothetical protein
MTVHHVAPAKNLEGDTRQGPRIVLATTQSISLTTLIGLLHSTYAWHATTECQTQIVCKSKLRRQVRPGMMSKACLFAACLHPPCTSGSAKPAACMHACKQATMHAACLGVVTVDNAALLAHLEIASKAGMPQRLCRQYTQQHHVS